MITRHSVLNPVKLSDSIDIEYFKMGKKPEWVGDVLPAVAIAVIPEVATTGKYTPVLLTFSISK